MLPTVGHHCVNIILRNERVYSEYFFSLIFLLYTLNRLRETGRDTYRAFGTTSNDSLFFFPPSVAVFICLAKRSSRDGGFAAADSVNDRD